MRRVICLVIIAISVLSLTGCGVRQTPYASRNAFLLDTIVTIQIYDRDVPEGVWEEAFDEIERLEGLLSAHKEGSDIARLNDSAGGSPVGVSPETLEVLQKSVEYSRLTGGLFDVTAGPLVALWAIKPPEGHVPTEAELSEVLPLIGWEDIEIDEESCQIYLPRTGMAIDLGAIAKGYIADRVKEVLEREGVEHAIINLGGNIQLIGETPYRIGIQDPDRGSGAYLGMIELADTSAASSGDYERYFEQDGVRYHHIMNPLTGYPADTGLRGVTVVSPRSIDADALSTSVFLLGPEEGMALIENLADTEAVLVTADREILLSSGLKERFKLAEGSGYRVVE
jgi:thiamine biosynthesis lipoprotein